MALESYYQDALAQIADLDLQQVEASEEARERLAAALSAISDSYVAPEVCVEEIAMPGPHGEVPVRVYRPLRALEQSVSLAGLVWVHGGGFAFGDLDMAESDCVAREICHRVGAVVVAVGYHLAQDGVHYPVPLDDVMAAYTWTVVRSAELGIDPLRLSLGGASAGASLSAGTALRLRDEDGPMPNCLLLAYPFVHAVLPPASDELAVKAATLPPVVRFAPEFVHWMIENYLGGPADAAPAYAVPATADLTGLPPTLVITSEYDDLRPSGEGFAAQLAAAAVSVQLQQEPGVLHGHLSHPWTQGAQRSLELMGRWVVDGKDALLHPAPVTHPQQHEVV